MRKVNIITGIVVAIIVILSAASLLLPSPVPPSASSGFHQQLVATLLIGLTHFAAALLFILSLSNFKMELRRADIMICVGMVTLGISQFIYPILTYMAVTNPAAYLLPSFIAIAADLLILWGVKRFAKLLSIEPKLLSWPVVIAMTILLAGLSTLLPHFPTYIPDGAFKFSQSLYVVSIGILLFTSSIMILIRRTTSSAYAAATGWFIAAQLSAVVSLSFLFTSNMIDPALLSWLPVPIITPLVLVGLFSMGAGYAFNTVGSYGQSVSQLHRKVTIIDVVLYTASLASNASEIDSTLDTLRVVTSRLAPDEQLTASDEAKLVKVYRDLEDYLVNREPLRKFDTATVRSNIAHQFNLSQSDSQFWSKLLPS